MIAAERSEIFQNNFDLVRLLAAIQVAVVHGVEHLAGAEKSTQSLILYLSVAPGVLIFFFVSGFLVAGSYARLNSNQEFFRRRALRIFPALWACFAVSLLLVVMSGYFTQNPPTVGEFAFWSLGQISFLQFYNPSFLREFGIGVLNGSLWTISVELQFYVLTPLLFSIMRKMIRIYIILLLIFMILNYVYVSGYISNVIFEKLISVSLIPWIFYYMVGQLAFFYYDKIIHLFRGKFLIWIVVYGTFFATVFNFTEISLGNRMPAFLGLLLVGTALSFAYSWPMLASKILKGNDISYGVYLYHMPIINIILFQGVIGGYSAVVLALAISTLLALFSWFLIEKPVLRLKALTSR